ncbi:hypothetical protein LJB95_00905 [Paludibacteraceae bacterium OttesenSCG-928-F17]|nr:hypothetical protein [Paludibacteraceae bacterium OttesenSCG-928-F17]
MKCHYTYTEDGEKIFIPGCMGAAVHGSKDFCTCSDNLTYSKIEKQEYNDVLNELKKEIKSYQSEIKHLHKVIEQLKNKI